MANLKDSHVFKVFNNYYTPKNAWKKIVHLIPTNKIIWECCMLNSISNSPNYLRDLLPNNRIVFDTNIDMLSASLECDMIITNPPFETDLKKSILKRLVDLNKPFIILLNYMNVCSNYFTDILPTQHTQIINIKGKINYDKLENGVITPTKNCSFYSCFVAYKMSLTPDQLFV
jgi:hypothetical protein